MITKLFEKSECRGIDAAGYWGTESGINGKVLYHKEPIKSSQFTQKDVWELVSKHNPNLLLAHARGASKGVGEPIVNSNNHPFTNSDKSVGLIHNGRVDECEYQSLKQKYGLKSKCDSEILLRIFEAGEYYSVDELKGIFVEHFDTSEFHQRLIGIRDIFSLINEGHMAVAVGERGEDGNRMLWLFRNRHRPLWIVDVRELLGQVFFISDPDIWDEAIRECSGIKKIIRTQKLIEMPTEEIWYFKITPEKPYPQNQRFQVFKENPIPWKFDGNKHELIHRNASFEVITNLDENDCIIQELPEFIEWEDFPLSEDDEKCERMIDLINDIKTNTLQLLQDQLIHQQNVDQLILSLEEHMKLVEGLNPY